jgi:hypothetical protein
MRGPALGLVRETFVFGAEARKRVRDFERDGAARQPEALRRAPAVVLSGHGRRVLLHGGSISPATAPCRRIVRYGAAIPFKNG